MRLARVSAQQQPAMLMSSDGQAGRTCCIIAGGALHTGSASRWVVPLPSVAAASAEEVHAQQKPWLPYTLLPPALVAQPQVGLELRGPSSQVELPTDPPVLITA